MDEKITDNNYPSFDILLPRKLHESEEGKKVLVTLRCHLKTVKPDIGFMAPSFPASHLIMNALFIARRTGRLIRGFEDAEKKLSAEQTGIASVDNKIGFERRERISRIVVVANDGSERFYRQTRKLVERNWPRVMAIHLDVTSFELGEKLFGPEKRALLLLINHKDAVIDFLVSLIR